MLGALNAFLQTHILQAGQKRQNKNSKYFWMGMKNSFYDATRNGDEYGGRARKILLKAITIKALHT